jgi:hypothetical protein
MNCFMCEACICEVLFRMYFQYPPKSIITHIYKQEESHVNKKRDQDLSSTRIITRTGTNTHARIHNARCC